MQVSFICQSLKLAAGDGLEELRQYTIANISSDLDEDTLTYALAAIATCKGLTKPGEAIMTLEDQELLDEFLEQY